MCTIGVLLVVFAGTALTSLESTEQGYVVTLRGDPKPKAGRRRERVPLYIVCDSAGLTVYRSPTEIDHIPAAEFEDPGTSSRITELVQTLTNLYLEKKRWPMLFVKPSGLPYMLALYRNLDDSEAKVKVGKFAFGEDSIIECQILDPWRL